MTVLNFEATLLGCRVPPRSSLQFVFIINISSISFYNWCILECVDLTGLFWSNGKQSLSLRENTVSGLTPPITQLLLFGAFIMQTVNVRGHRQRANRLESATPPPAVNHRGWIRRGPWRPNPSLAIEKVNDFSSITGIDHEPTLRPLTCGY